MTKTVAQEVSHEQAMRVGSENKAGLSYSYHWESNV